MVHLRALTKFLVGEGISACVCVGSFWLYRVNDVMLSVLRVCRSCRIRDACCKGWQSGRTVYVMLSVLRVSHVLRICYLLMFVVLSMLCCVVASMRSRSPEADACERMRRMRSKTMLSRYWMLEIRDLQQKVSRRLGLGLKLVVVCDAVLKIGYHFSICLSRE